MGMIRRASKTQLGLLALRFHQLQFRLQPESLPEVLCPDGLQLVEVSLPSPNLFLGGAVLLLEGEQFCVGLAEVLGEDGDEFGVGGAVE